MLSVVIPTGIEPENSFIVQTLKTLALFPEIEVVLVEKGEANSRAQRLNIGFSRTRGSMILFHHPRSVLEPEGLRHLVRSSTMRVWGAFSHEFDHFHPWLHWTSWYSNNIRGRMNGIFYLDHCIFFHRDLWQGDIPAVDIFEDTLLSTSLRAHSRPVLLPYRSRTSAVRFLNNGIYLQSFMNQVLKLGYHMGVSHEVMNRIYEKGLGLNSTYTPRSGRQKKKRQT